MTGNVDFSQTLHITHGSSAAETLKVALRLGRDRVLVNDDPIDCGPASATSNLESWRKLREPYLQLLYGPESGVEPGAVIFGDITTRLKHLPGGSSVVVWLATCLAEQLLLAWLINLSERGEAGPFNLYTVQFERLRPAQIVRGIGELSPEQIQAFAPPARRLSDEEVRIYLSAWSAYTSDEPSELIAFLEREEATGILHRSMARLVYRYPSSRTGLSYCDEELLKWVKKKGPRAIRVVGYTMGYNETEDWLADSYLFRRLVSMGAPSLRRPLVTVSGDAASMRTCEVEVTEFGNDVLKGAANATRVNGIDDWVGGVHLNNSSRIPYRAGETLELEPPAS